MTVNVRFAPSPTGKLHVGNVRAALFNYLFARKNGGSFLLRSDDTDQERSTTAYEEGILRDLRWLGLVHDRFARQSERFDTYREITAKLKVEGLLYPCYETAEDLDRKRKLQRARGMPPVYDRAALELTDSQKRAFEDGGRQPHWRYKLSRKNVSWDDLVRGEVVVDTSTISDPVLIREDGQFLYTLPSCIDDVEFGITHVIRGEDHVTNTAAQVEIFRALITVMGDGEIPSFAHHSLLVGKDGEGLSKRLGSLSIEAMREDGLEPEAVTSLLARLGTSDPVEPRRDLDEMANGFDFDRLGRAPARFDPEELVALNARILHMTDYADLSERLHALEIDPPLWDLARGNVDRLADVAQWRDVVRGQVTPVIDDADRPVTDAASRHVPEGDVTESDWKLLVDRTSKNTGAKGKRLFMPLRKALTGLDHGPELAPLFVLLGAERAKARLSGETA